MEARYERERDFHNEAFNAGGRAVVGKFYSVTRASRALYEELLDRFGSGGRALEYGCGLANYAFFLADRGAHVTGIDISDEAIDQGRRRAQEAGAERVDFELMNAEELTFDDRTFELVCGTGVIHHLDLDRAYGDIARTLKPDGHAVFIEPLGHNPLINLYRKRTPALRTEDEHPLRLEDLRRAEQWFGSVDARYFHLLSLAAVPLRRTPLFQPLLRGLEALDALLFRLVPPARRFAWQVVLVLGSPRPVQ